MKKIKYEVIPISKTDDFLKREFLWVYKKFTVKTLKEKTLK